MTDAAPIALVCILFALTIVWLVAAIVHDRGTRDMRAYRLAPYWEEPGDRDKNRLIRCVILIAILVLNIVFSITGAVIVGPYSCIVLCILCMIAARGDAYVERFGDHLANRLSTRLGRATVVAAVIVLEFFALELPSNPEYYKMLAHPLTILAELVMIALVTLVLWFAFQRRRFGLIVSATIFCLLGIAEYFVAYFKHMPILPSDLMALSTAAAVSSSYKYVLDERCLISIATVFCASALGRAYERNDTFSAKTLSFNLASAGMFALALFLFLTKLNFLSAFHMQVRAWRPLDDYRLYGFLPSFTAGVQAVFVTPPEDYDKEGAEQMMAAYAQEWDEGEGADPQRASAVRQFNNLQPSVVVIMNETFSDLSIYDNLGTNYNGPQFFNQLEDYLMKGTLYVSAFGGGTCNTEFEFLTGHTINYMGASVYPYTLYNMDGVENLAAQFAGMGYHTSAMHPNLPTNWDRDVVYQQFGFEDFYSLADFQDAETLRGFVTDAATYDLCLDILNSSDEPQFIFDVTMQNHSGYKKGTLPYSKQTHWNVAGVGHGKRTEINEYLALIQESDRSLRTFIEELSALDRPVILVFFGDHQPYFPDTLNDSYFPNEDELVHQMRLWQTSYLIWTNYEVAGAERIDRNMDLSTNYLGAMMLNAVGAPLTDFEKCQLSLKEHLNAINLIGYELPDGTYRWGDPIDEGYSFYHDLESIQYRYFFDIERQGSLWKLSTGPGVTDPNELVVEEGTDETQQDILQTGTEGAVDPDAVDLDETAADAA